MARSGRKLNFMIRNDVAQELETLVQPGQRSKLVNDAIMRELVQYRRNLQTEKLLELRNKNPKLSTDELLDALRHDRERG